MRTAIAVVLIFMAFGGARIACASAAEPDADAGRLYAMQNCASCHNVSSRDPKAPPWRLGPSFAAVANEKTTTEIGLHVFLQTPHATMPNIIIPEQDRRNIVAHILTLKANFRGNGT